MKGSSKEYPVSMNPSLNRPPGMRIALCTVLSLLLMLSAQVAQAGNNHSASRIELKDGRIYNNVTFSVDRPHGIVILGIGTGNREVGIGKILLVLDQDGNDVSRELLGSDYSPELHPHPSTAEPVGKSVSYPQDRLWTTKGERPWRASVSVFPDYTIPLGAYYEGLDPGLGFGVAASLCLSPHWAVRGTLSRSGLKDRKIAGSQISGAVVLEDNSRLDIWRYGIAIEFHGWPGKDKGRRTLYHTYLGIGSVNHSLTGNLVLYYSYPPQTYVEELGYSESKVMLNVGGGITYMLSSAFGLDLGFDILQVFIRRKDSDWDPWDFPSLDTSYQLDFRAGVTTLF